MDSGVIEAFVAMDCVLSYVERVGELKDEEQLFLALIEESLHIIEACGRVILKYLNSNTKGACMLMYFSLFIDLGYIIAIDRVRSALSSDEGLSQYQNQLKSLGEALNRLVNVHVAHRLEENHKVLTNQLEHNHKEVMEVLEKIDVKPANFQPSSTSPFQSIIPPPPTDVFTGRDDYLRLIETSLMLPKTSVELGKQRRYVLYGTGGMGKTQLALKFLDKNSER